MRNENLIFREALEGLDHVRDVLGELAEELAEAIELVADPLQLSEFAAAAWPAGELAPPE